MLSWTNRTDQQIYVAVRGGVPVSGVSLHVISMIIAPFLLILILWFLVSGSFCSCRMPQGYKVLLLAFAHGRGVGDNAPTRTEDPDNQTNDIAKGGVCTGWDARTVRFVFVSICCGVARLTNIQISQHTPWGSTLPKKRTEKKEWQEKKNDHPLEPYIPNCDQPKHPKILKTSLKANQDPRIQRYSPKILIRLLRSSIPQS